MNDVILFAGTTEGRKIAEACRGKALTLHVSVATEYGEALIEPAENIRVLPGRKDAAQIAALIRETGASPVIDATHPYAASVTKTLQDVCAELQTEYVRVLRREEHELTENCIFAADTAEAVSFLNSVQGNVLLTVGSKELPHYAEVRNAAERLYVRILPLMDGMKQAEALGFSGKHLICMQGPFSEELNAAMLRAVGARYLVTKDSGTAGGFPEKIRAAKACGVTPVVIRRPLQEEGIGVEECLALLGKRFGFTADQEKQVTILGTGTGDPGSLTLAAEQTCAEADLIIGAERLLETLTRFGKETAAAVLPQDIKNIIDASGARKIVVAMSGDTGFFSGTKKLLPLLAEYHPAVLPGISSVAGFCSRIGASWDDAVLASVHGRACNYVAKARRNPKLILLAGGEGKVEEILRTLTEYGLGQVRVTVGENISYENEQISRGTAVELCERSFDSLALLLIENPEAATMPVTQGRPDEDFLRTQVPMTKQEVRAVTLAKLRLPRTGMLWDIGAGTGSVSLEMAECCEDGTVYAVEQKEDACALIRDNMRHLGIANVEVICGKAPECLADLPAPTHVFIGGSSGDLREVTEAVLRKNPAARIVLNTVTAETFAEAVTLVKSLPVKDVDIVQISAARSRELGGYHLMTAQNPVYVISFIGGGDG
ncbi:MAG: precorrin-6A reductase [Lachnospiraceae bacterium]|nr:precorrin-6A reductase [Lachnospiraceae bacterium]